MNDENIFAANTLFVLHINFAIRELLDGDFTQSGTILLSYGTCQGRITGTGEYCERTFQVGLLALKDSGLHKTKGCIPSHPFECCCPGRTRTPTYWTKTRCPAIRRPGNISCHRQTPKIWSLSNSIKIKLSFLIPHILNTASSCNNSLIDTQNPAYFDSFLPLPRGYRIIVL